MREYIIHSPLHPQAVRRVRRVRARLYVCACVRARVHACVSGVDEIRGKVEVEEEDLYVVESGGEKGGGITAVPFIPRGGGRDRKKRNPEDCPPMG